MKALDLWDLFSSTSLTCYCHPTSGNFVYRSILDVKGFSMCLAMSAWLWRPRLGKKEHSDIGVAMSCGRLGHGKRQATWNDPLFAFSKLLGCLWGIVMYHPYLSYYLSAYPCYPCWCVSQACSIQVYHGVKKRMETLFKAQSNSRPVSYDCYDPLFWFLAKV